MFNTIERCVSSFGKAEESILTISDHKETERASETTKALDTTELSKQQATEAIIDRKALMEHVCGNRKLLNKIVGVFLKNSPAMISEIEKAISGGDSKALTLAAHAMKGSVANFSTKAAFNVSFKLEKIGKSGDLRRVEETFIELKEEIDRFIPAITSLINENESNIH